MTYPPQDPYSQPGHYPQPSQYPQAGGFQQPSPYPQQPQYGAPAVIDDGRRSRKRPLGVALIIAAIALFIVAIVVAIALFPRPGGFPRTSGTNSTVELTAGTWTVFAEGQGSRPIGIEAPDGTVVTVGPQFSSSNYTIGGRSGTSVGSIEAPVDGTYTVVTAPGDTFAFGQNFGRDITVSILSGILGFFGGALLFIVGVVLVVMGKRR
ncbi:MAG: hypothetical protein AAF962_07970 [Actinomycetota bacterium]